MEKLTKYLYKIDESVFDIRQLVLLQAGGGFWVGNSYVSCSGETNDLIEKEWIKHHQERYKETK